MPERIERSFADLIGEGEHHPTKGWDFSWLGDRMKTTPLPWDFTALVAERARVARSMLDLGTGGGEWLAALPVRAPRTVATEGWAANVPVARQRLEPLGIDVVQVDGAPDNARQEGDELVGQLPFEADSFELITSRHESFLAREVGRVLMKGGTFLTQQLGDGVYREFNELLGAEPPQQKTWRLPLAVEQVENVGLTVNRSDEGQETVTFADVGALAWYLRMIPWTVLHFSVGKYRSRLEELHAEIESDGPITLPLPGFYLEAVKE